MFWSVLIVAFHYGNIKPSLILIVEGKLAFSPVFSGLEKFFLILSSSNDYVIASDTE